MIETLAREVKLMFCLIGDYNFN